MDNFLVIFKRDVSLLCLEERSIIGAIDIHFQFQEVLPLNHTVSHTILISYQARAKIDLSYSTMLRICYNYIRKAPLTRKQFAQNVCVKKLNTF